VRILHFSNYADRVGGAEIYAHGLVEGLRARGHTVGLFGGSPEREVDGEELRVVRRPVYDAARLVKDAALLNALKEFIERFQPEVVHAHNVFSVALEVVDSLGRCGVPLLQTVHDYQLLCPNSWCVRGDGSPCPGGAGAQCFQHDCQKNYPYDSWGVLLSALRQRLASAGVRIAIAPSSHLAERLRSHGWREVRHLPYFIDGLRASSNGPRTDHDLLYVGRLEREKGVDVLLEALPAVLAAIPRVQLTLVGGGSQEPALRRQAEQSKLGSAVRFLTQIPREELSIHYARAAACILPSVWTENSPLVAYECLSAGLPMIGSRIGGIPELIEPPCGFTFEPRNPTDLARVVIRFLRLPLAERQQMSMAARRRAENYQRPAHLLRIEELYREAVSLPSAQDPMVETLRELFPVLEQVNLDRPYRPDSGARSSPLELLRGIARELGLPKVLKR
jgi:glycosyltransferase involved in cell wall biosynthesis